MANLCAGTLKITPLRLANVPPPMARHETTLEKNAKDVAINASGTRIAVLCEQDIYVYSYDIKKKPIPDPVLLWHATAETGYETRQVCFRGDSDVFVLAEEANGEASVILRFEIGTADLPIPIFEPHPVSSLFCSVDWDSICVQTSAGLVLELGADGEWKSICRFPKPTPWPSLIHHAGEVIPMPLEKITQLTDGADNYLWSLEQWKPFRQWSCTRPKLHIFRRDTCPPHLYHYPTSSQICPYGLSRR